MFAYPIYISLELSEAYAYWVQTNMGFSDNKEVIFVFLCMMRVLHFGIFEIRKIAFFVLLLCGLHYI